METLTLIGFIALEAFLVYALIAFPTIVISDMIRCAKEDKKDYLRNRRTEIIICKGVVIEEQMKFLNENEHLSEKQKQNHERWIYLDNEHKRFNKELDKLY